MGCSGPWTDELCWGQFLCRFVYYCIIFYQTASASGRGHNLRTHRHQSTSYDLHSTWGEGVCVWVCVCFNVLQHISCSSGGSEAALPPWICSNWTSVRLSDLGLTEVHWTVCVSLWLYDHARVRLCVNMGGCTGVCSGGCRPSVCMWMWMC